MDIFKKVGLGAVVLGVFVGYSLWVRHEQPQIMRPVSTAQPATSSAPSSPANPSTAPAGSSAGQQSQYRDGVYTGSVADAFYGNVQVSATISGGKLAAVTFLQYPNTHQTSVFINQQAMPQLQQEAVRAQSAHVDVVTGATFTSQAFAESLGNALAQAKA